jgi:hypothetical protein
MSLFHSSIVKEKRGGLKNSRLSQDAEFPQSQILDTIFRGSGRFGRTVKTIARMRLDEQQSALGSSMF